MGKSDVSDEQRANFAPYKIEKKRKVGASTVSKKSIPWSARFVCLADTDVHYVPFTIAQREALVEAGLGEKKSKYWISTVWHKNSVTKLLIHSLSLKMPVALN